MANLIKFLRGTQDSLNTLIQNGKATEGAFYLTSDTNRLYIGKTISGEGDSAVIKPVSVNQGVISVSTLKDLPGEENNKSATKVPGEFYYVTGTEADPLNILCVYNGKTWVQVNPTYDDTEIQAAIEEINEGIGTINGAIDTINENLTKKADLVGAAFTGPVTLTLGETVANNEAVTKKYVEDYVTDAVANADITVGAKFDKLEEEVAGLSGDIEATAKLVGKLTDSDADTDITTIVDYIDSVKAVADSAASVAGSAVTQDDFDDHVEEYGKFVKTTNEALGTINGALDTKANLADANFAKASINNKAIATEEYANGVAETKANDAKKAVLGDAETYTDLGKVEAKIELLAEADAGLDGKFADYVKKDGTTDFTAVPKINGVYVATTDDIEDVTEAIVGDAATDYNTLGKIEDKIIALDGAYKAADAGLQAQIDKIKGSVSDLANVMAFVGVTTTEITDGATTSPIAITDNNAYVPDIGDVVIYNGEEFVWDGSAWAQIGSADATTAALEALEKQITDNKKAYDDYVAANDIDITALKEADAGFTQALSDLGTTVTNNNAAFEAYKTTNDKAVSDNATAIGGLTTTVNGLVESSATKEELAGETAARTNAVNDIIAQLTWGSFDPEN